MNESKSHSNADVIREALTHVFDSRTRLATEKAPAALRALDQLEEQLETAQRALRDCAALIDARYPEGTTEYQVVLIARDVLERVDAALGSSDGLDNQEHLSSAKAAVQPYPEACPNCGCLTFTLVNTSLHMDAPDGAVLCTNCGKGWVHSVDERGVLR